MRRVLARRWLGPSRPGHAARAFASFTVDTPYISESVPLADGVLGVIEELRVAPGDLVKEGTVVAVVDTHKAALEVRSPAAGKVVRILVNVGDEIQERKPVMEVDGP
ncbi:hypothetical protein KFE25_009838 [Diacronema lutheri]|uniref:Lipoyl-binding domain-containing protein n=2 Tax=Diacronema lutheri TaxID=2081491 RepID=A0A8J6C2Z0_DIALT|nr:hypothetical protein KFE25_009838 [Diacronema lutheri]